MIQCVGILQNTEGYSTRIQFLVTRPEDSTHRLRMIADTVMPGRVKSLKVESILPLKESVK